MKLLLLTKRHFMSKDIIEEAYGRQYELATRLAASGWTVQSHCLNYKSIRRREAIDKGGVEWHSYAAPLQWYSWIRQLNGKVTSWKPDLVFACSDPLHIVTGYRCARRMGVPLAVDLHDNLESFHMIDLPGLRRRLVEAVRDANLVSCVSAPLGEMVAGKYHPRGKVVVLENAAPDDFTEAKDDKSESRHRFGIDGEDSILGVAGALYRKRGIETILEGFDLVRAKDPRVMLVLAGPSDKFRRGFQRAGVRYFGNLDYSLVPSFLGMLDVGIVPNIRPAFADYCYPQKAVELCALSVPVVGADLGVMRDLAGANAQILYRPDDPADFARAVEYQLAHRVLLESKGKSWGQQARKLDKAMREVLS